MQSRWLFDWKWQLWLRFRVFFFGGNKQSALATDHWTGCTNRKHHKSEAVNWAAHRDGFSILFSLSDEDKFRQKKRWLIIMSGWMMCRKILAPKFYNCKCFVPLCKAVRSECVGSLIENDSRLCRMKRKNDAKRKRIEWCMYMKVSCRAYYHTMSLVCNKRMRKITA